ncbi:UNVERIFIED_CONTAM: integral membrane protein [Brevibacillus sp. OAP136]
MKTALSRMRLIALIEGLSYLFLLFIAMPLKYFAGFPQVVTVAGGLHGLFFVLYLIALINVTIADGWKFGRVLFTFVIAFVPFGNFILDSRLRKE